MRAAKVLIFFATITVVACGGPRATAPVAAPQAKRVPSTIAEAKMELAAGNTALYDEGLVALSHSADPDTRLQAQALLSNLRRDQHRFGESIVALRNAANDNPDLAPYLLVRATEVQFEAGDLDSARKTATEVLSRSASARVSDDAKILLARAAALSKDPLAVQQTLGDLSAVHVDEFSERKFAELASNLQAGGFGDYAARVWFRILSEYPQGRSTESAYANLAKLTGPSSPLERIDYAESMKLADRLGRFNRYDQVLDLLDRVAKKFPDRIDSPDFRYLRAKSLFNSRNYDEVVGVAAPAGEPYSTAIDLLRARALWRTGHNAEFESLTQRIVDSFPGTKQALEGKLLLAKYAMTDAPDYARASALLESAIADGGAGADGENLWTLAWLNVGSGNDEKALETLDRYLAAYPDADYTSNSLFWAGKVLGHLGRIDERNARFRKLVETYPYSYFSYRARQIAGLPFPASSIDGALPFPDISKASPELTDALRLASRLGLIEFASEAARELKTAVAAKPDDIAGAYAIADFYSRSGEGLKAIGILQSRFRDVIRHGASGVPDRFWQILFPLPYRETIAAAAARANVDALLVPAIIRQESGFDPSIVSNAGAVGIMQIMPEEASRIASRAGLGETVTREALFDPATNIQVGAAEIAQKLEAMNGNVFYAVAAYNAGEQAVGRWIAQSGNEDIDFFVESIPYNETKLYVKNVIRNRFEYQRIYGQPSPSPAPS